MPEGRTLLFSEELEMIVVLRMNDSFMQFMRQSYAHVAMEKFGRTVVLTNEGSGLSTVGSQCQDNDDDDANWKVKIFTWRLKILIKHFLTNLVWAGF